ncbi:MAG: 3-deoxy-7-phosphoheptulonate synthase [Leptospiraceae bacterium]|nr:3-deoxy-7-phosphoheptulonate synthase [Leptospiraceae bacterium]
MHKLDGVNVRAIEPLLSPAELIAQYPVTEDIARTVYEGRETIRNILSRKDDRFLVVMGPCSVHDPAAAVEYAQKLKKIAEEVKDRIYIVMRVYFEKPRTTIGWKGLITDPQLDGKDDMPTGLATARKLLLDVASLGLSSGTEFLDPIVPQYISDLISWAAIGARTTESQTHRQMASGLSMPVGFKNSTDGNTQTAIDAMQSSRSQHSFLGIDENGRTAVVRTNGNPWGHVILRGGHNLTNYDPQAIKTATDKLTSAGCNPVVMVDCSHANSGKKFERQEVVWKSIIEQRVSGNESLVGMMLESNLFEGNQKLPEPLDETTLTKLKHGVSITDACVGWEQTDDLLHWAYDRLENIIKNSVKKSA